MIVRGVLRSFNKVNKVSKMIGVLILLGVLVNLSLFTHHNRPCKDEVYEDTNGSSTAARATLASEEPRFLLLPNHLKVAPPEGGERLLHFRRRSTGVVSLSRGVEPPAIGRRSAKWSEEQRHHVNFTVVKVMVSTMPSTRHSMPWGSISKICRRKTYDISKFPSVSVLLTFHEHEHLTRILHTIHSIIQRTPPSLLQEIILIDDHSTKEELKEILPLYIKSVFGPKVSLHANKLRRGLIGARLAGTRLAKADVIVSMDSHMEVQDMWLEPLLEEIVRNRKTMAATYLDWMEYDSAWKRWNYRHGASSWKTYFDWAFTVGFQDIPGHMKRGRDPTMAVDTPVTIGTMFAIDRRFFIEVGEFDDGMDGWGGENIDLPLRVWMFGGRVVNVPCSHAAHFEAARYRDYRLAWGLSIVRNYRRVSDVWFGNYSRYFYMYKRGAQGLTSGNLTSRYALRDRSMYDFSWFLKNVFPELGIPDVNTHAWGGVMNVKTRLCIQVFPPADPYLSDCLPRYQERQGIFWAVTGELRLPLHAFNAVTGRVGADTTGLHTEETIPNYNTSVISRWMHWKDGPLIDWLSRRCLSVSGSLKLGLAKCNVSDSAQQWSFRNYTSDYWRLQGPIPPPGSSYFQKILSQIVRSVKLGRMQTVLRHIWSNTYGKGPSGGRKMSK